MSSSSQQINNLEDLLFEAGCDDATLSISNGVTYLQFDREADQFSTINSAIEQVESLNNLFVIERINNDNLITQ